MPVALTGIAASLLDGGITAHTRFRIPTILNENSVSSIKPLSSEANLLKESDLIIWDEVSTAHKYMFECVDRLFRDITGVNKPFGGKVFLVCGDFRQILPVVKHGSSVDIVQASIKRSKVWQYFLPKQKFALTQNMRVLQSEKEFVQYLLQLGNGTLPTFDDFKEIIKIDDNCVIDEKESIIDHVFGKHIPHDDVTHHKKAILCPKNDAR